MKTKIYKYIQENPQGTVNFDSILKHLSQEYSIINKQDLGKTIRQLADENLVAEINKNFYDLTNLESKSGFVHWNLNQLSWIEEKDLTNEYGIAFNGNEGLLAVANKKKANYGSYVSGKILTVNEKDYFYITEEISAKDVLIIAAFKNETNSWHVLNSNSGFKFKNELNTTELNDGDVSLFLKSNSTYSLKEKIGNISEKGLESIILQKIVGIKEAPPFVEQKAIELELCDKPFFSIDALSTRDIDDAIWIEKNDNGYKLFVAIADVSSYVKPGDEQDILAQEKSTTFYLANKTIHMINRNLSENYCSLILGETRGAMICELDYDNSGNVISYEFYNKKIKIHSRLNYDDVNLMTEGNTPENSTLYHNGNSVSLKDHFDSDLAKNILTSVKTLEDFAKFFPSYEEPGYWFLASPQFKLGENGKIQELYFDERNSSKSQKMVEVSMLAANKAAAQFLQKNYPHLGLFRNQLAPAEEIERPKPAFYNADNEGHWGLKTEFYTHFTSPIRRYCDLVVHRLIKNVLSNNTLEQSYDKDILDTIVKQINYQQYITKQCQSREKTLLMNQYVEHLVSTKTLKIQGEIVDFNKNGIVIRNKQLIENYIPLFKVNRPIVDKIKELDLDTISVEEKNKVLTDLNEIWKVKCFIDKYHWLDDNKEQTFKFYEREFKQESEAPKMRM